MYAGTMRVGGFCVLAGWYLGSVGGVDCCWEWDGRWEMGDGESGLIGARRQSRSRSKAKPI